MPAPIRLRRTGERRIARDRYVQGCFCVNEQTEWDKEQEILRLFLRP